MRCNVFIEGSRAPGQVCLISRELREAYREPCAQANLEAIDFRATSESFAEEENRSLGKGRWQLGNTQ